MFYSVFVLGKKGPLARVWLAAHWDKKITKAQILETNIVESVDSILQPRVKLSLRTSSHLLLGIVRIYARKTLYLLQDCQDAAFKIKSAFRPDAVDLPDGKTEASIAAITLPEMLEFVNDFDLITEPPQVALDMPPATSANIRSITLQEDMSSIHVDDPILNEMRDWGDISSVRGDTTTERGERRENGERHDSHPLDIFDRPIQDEFGPADVDDIFQLPSTGEIQDELHRERGEGEQARPDSRMSAASSYSAPPSMAPSGGPSTPGVPSPGEAGGDIFPSAPERKAAEEVPSSMELGPLPESLPNGFGRRKRRKKLGVLFDEIKTLSGEEMKSQLSDTGDIVQTLDLAPPTKKLMNWKRTGGAEKLFSLPERMLHSKVLSLYYSRNLITSRVEGEEESLEDIIPSSLEIARDELGDDFRPPPSPLRPGLRPPKPREKYEKEIKSPRKKRTREDKENHERQLPKSPRPKTPRPSDLESGRFQDSTFEPSRKSMEPTLDFDDDGYGDDYEQPMSIGPNDDHMMPDETAEQFEERVRNKRSNVLLRYMSNQLDISDMVRFSDLVKSNRRKQVAQKFYSLLVLKKQQAIELEQDPNVEYAEIIISRGPKYDDALAACSA